MTTCVVKAGLRRPARGLSRDSLVQVNGVPHHLDAELAVAWGGAVVVLADEAGEPWTLRRFAPYRPATFASHLVLPSHRLAVFGYAEVGGVRVEYSAQVDLDRMTAEVAV